MAESNPDKDVNTKVAAPASALAGGEPLNLTEFRREVNRSFVPLQITTEQPEFRGTIRGVNVHGVGFTDVRADPHLVTRTPELIAASTQHFYKISVQLEGPGVLRQGGRTVELRPGDLAVYDTAMPYELEFTSPFRVLVMMLPHSRLGVPHGLATRFTAIRIPGSEGLGRVISPFLATLGLNMQELRGPAGAKLAQNAVDLLATLLSNGLDLARATADPHLALLQRIREYIAAHLAEPTLSPSSIAADMFISVRHLHNLFHEQGETVAAYIRTQRLERTYHELIDPRRGDTPVSVIGARWGFRDPAHFSRTFKQQFGQSPSEVRRHAIGG